MSEENELSQSVIMELPRNILVGSGALADLPGMARSLGLAGPAIAVCDPVTRKVAGDAAAGKLTGAGIETSVFVLGDDMRSDIERLKEAVSRGGARLLLGVGGGRPIDVAKFASKEAGIPFISVPTAASHDGIVSSRASIRVGGVSKSVAAQAPIAVVLDTRILAASPFRLMAAGCGDIISNYSAVLDWDLARRLKNEPYSNYAAALSRMTAEIIVENADKIKPQLEESAKLVAKALISSGVAMSIAGSSRPASGAEHMFSHRLDELAPKPAMHGEQCALGTIAMLYLHGEDWKRIRDAMRVIGLPTTARGLGIPDEVVIEALVSAHTIRAERFTILGAGINRNAAVEALSRTGIIGA